MCSFIFRASICVCPPLSISFSLVLLPLRDAVQVDADDFPGEEEDEEREEDESREGVRHGGGRALLGLTEHVNDLRLGVVLEEAREGRRKEEERKREGGRKRREGRKDGRKEGRKDGRMVGRKDENGRVGRAYQEGGE